MSSPDHPTNPPSSGLPIPPDGVGAADLTTESTDPAELRELLDRARERLAFYESFDRIIGENIRRSGELMVETVSLREQAQVLAAQSARERTEFEATRQADRDRYRALVADALAEVERTRPLIDGLAAKLQGVLDSLGNEAAGSAESVATTSALVEPWHTEPESTESAPSHDEASTRADAGITTEAPAVDTTEPTTTEDASVPADATEPEATPEPVARNLTVLAHNVPNAKVAIALQKTLRELEVVSSVDAREFANGELRLAVIATGALPQSGLTGWLADHNGEISSSSPSVMELTFME